MSDFCESCQIHIPMNIQGLQKLTLLDYPGKVAATVFLGGCNFRCPWCHNKLLVDWPLREPISQQAVLDFLHNRTILLDGVCISGGEPTLQPELPGFLAQIKSLDLSVKLDTNGTNPKMLKQLVSDGLVDYVAMDIKNSQSRYAETCGLSIMDVSPIQESAAFLLSEPVDYEFRTTVVQEFHNADALLDISTWIAGAKRYFLQQYSGDDYHAFAKPQMDTLADVVRPRVPSVQVRGC